MSKIFEALQNAQREVKGLDQVGVLQVDADAGLEHVPDEVMALDLFAEPPGAIPAPVQSSSVVTALDMEEDMIGLHQRLDALLPGAARRVVQFIASRPGEGTSTIARAFARVSATRFGKLVLLLDAGPGSGYAVDSGQVLPAGAGHTNLYRAPLPAFSASHASKDRGPRSDAFWDDLRQRYELVVVDAPPATASADGLALCGKADGVVLVVEAEGTRWPVAQSVKDAIVRSGGKVFGVVLNKRRFYIPSFIYRRF